MRSDGETGQGLARKLTIVASGFVRRAVPGTDHATFTYPTLTVLSTGTILATFRSGSSKDTADETAELYASSDGGRTWEQKPLPVPRVVGGKQGSPRSCHITELAPGHWLAAVMWVDRESFPGEPLFNPQTEGCLPMLAVLADSLDNGRTWSAWRVVPMPAEIGPASITTAIMKLADGRLALSIESNKTYLDHSRWLQKVVLFHSDDQGQTWGPPVVSGFDPTGRLFYWDQRAGVTHDGRIAAFAWTYDTSRHRYLHIHRRLSSDGGMHWSDADDVGFADQAGHPAMLTNGGVVLPYVDRFGSQTIRARWAPDAAAAFDPESDVVIYAHPQRAKADAETGTTGEALGDMTAWCYGLPYAETLPNGEVLVVYYAGNDQAMDACWVRIHVRESQRTDRS